MTSCNDFRTMLDAYRAGSLDDARSVALEEHAAGCAGCEALMESATAGVLPAFAPPLPDSLRAPVLRAVAARRRTRRAASWARVAAMAGAAALLLLTLRPATKSAQSPAGDSVSVATATLQRDAVAADEIARSEFRALDDAARELQAALQRAPGDAELSAFLRSVNDQRDALRRQVQDAES